ncbi:MAG TPA: hypothetical protein VF838_01260 [Trebonia sp.]
MPAACGRPAPGPNAAERSARFGKGFIIDELSAEPLTRQALFGSGGEDEEQLVEVRLRVRGRPPVGELAAALSEIDDVAAVLVGDEQDAA